MSVALFEIRLPHLRSGQLIMLRSEAGCDAKVACRLYEDRCELRVKDVCLQALPSDVLAVAMCISRLDGSDAFSFKSAPLPIYQLEDARFVQTSAYPISLDLSPHNHRLRFAFVSVPVEAVLGDAAPSQALDAILVPGGGAPDDIHSIPQTLPAWVTSRLTAAASFWHAHPIPKPYVITLSVGTVHKPNPHDTVGRPLPECTAAMMYLHNVHHIPYECLLEEAVSTDTVGNFWYARVLHTDVMCLKRLLVVTSDFHAARCAAAASWVYGVPSCASSLYDAVLPKSPDEIEDAPHALRFAGDCAVYQLGDAFATGGRWDAPLVAPDAAAAALSEVKFSRLADGYEVGVCGAPDEGDEDMLRARCAKEEAAVLGVLTNRARVCAKSVAEMHAWVHSEHAAYAAKAREGLHFKAVENVKDPALLKSYG